MTSLELEALRRQVEDDFKLDIAAIERLQRRFNLGGSGAKAVAERPVAVETNVVSLPQAMESRGQQAPPDELTESLRTMFSSYRK